MSDYFSESSGNMPLFDYGQHAAETRSAAFNESKPKQNARKDLALIVLRKAGKRGHTRESLGDAISLRIQSICPIALAIIQVGDAVETDERRKTSSGCWATVIVAVEFAGESVQ
jgi:hypothetical protein